LIGTARIFRNMLLQPSARGRVLGMRRLFRKYERNLAAFAIVARKAEAL
jgi:hypothetical protein